MSPQLPPCGTALLKGSSQSFQLWLADRTRSSIASVTGAVWTIGSREQLHEQAA